MLELILDFFLTGLWTLLWAALFCALLLYLDHRAQRRRRRRHYGVCSDWPARPPANDHIRRTADLSAEAREGEGG